MEKEKLDFSQPVSLGLLLTYKCNIACRYCIYNCSPKWKSDWLKIEDAKKVFKRLAYIFQEIYIQRPEHISFSYGLHFTGGEPFLNYGHLLKLTALAKEYDIPSVFAETNCFWAENDTDTEEMLLGLRDAGMQGIMISINPFNVEKIPVERIERASKISQKVFGKNTFIYQRFFLELYKRLGIKNTLSFEGLLKKVSLASLSEYIELLPMGRASYKLDGLFNKRPASYYFGQNCYGELTRNWHTHIDNYLNYIPGFCAGISLGKADKVLLSNQIELDDKPVLKSLAEDIKGLYILAIDHGFKEEKSGYISKCHLCFAIRKHLVKAGSFKELAPLEYYDRV